MNALSINIPANFIASCESTLKRYNAAKTDAERRAVLDRQTVQGLWWAIGFVSKIPAACMSEKTIYKTLAPFFDAVDGTEEKALKFTAPGYMDLCIEALGYNDHEGRPVYSVAHYGEQNGDLMRDPDVTMGVDREAGTVEPLTYQNDYIGRYWEVYKDYVDGKPTKYYPAMKKDLSAMVTAWAKNIKAQGFNPAVHA